ALGRELGNGAREGWDEDHRVVAEATLAAGLPGHAATTLAARVVLLALAVEKHHVAHVAAAALLQRHAGQALEQICVLSRPVGQPFPAGAVPAWRPVERVDLEPGVLGQRGEAGRDEVGMCLLRRVRHECRASLLGHERQPEVGRGDELEWEISQQRAQLALLPRAGGGEEEAVARAERWFM